MPTFTSFEQLPCWQKCREVKLWTIELLPIFPSHEMFELAMSIKKCARSATQNLAEGFGKHSMADKINFCRMSRGSLFELQDDLLTASDEGYLSAELYAEGLKLIEAAVHSINGYIRYLDSRKRGDWNTSN